MTSKVVPRYICLDGGGSKIECRVLDKHGRSLKLVHKGITAESAFIEGANINFDGAEKVEQALRQVFDEVFFEEQPLSRYKVQVIAGMAGVARPDPKAKVTEIFEKIGIASDSLILQGDVEMALNAIPEKNAIVVVCGTGNVIFGKVNGQIIDKDGNFFRLGGWGLEQDKASGYAIGMAGLKAVRAEEYEKAPKTALTTAFKTAFAGQKVLDVLTKIQNKEITTKEVALFQRQVFDAASKKDAVSADIVHEYFVHYVLEQLDIFITRHELQDAPVHFMGGLMKSEWATQILEYGSEMNYHNKVYSNVAENYVTTNYF